MKVETFAYPALIEKTDGGRVVTFRDIPQAVGQIEDNEDAVEASRESLQIAINYFFEGEEPIPAASGLKKGEILVTLPISYVAKIALHNAMIRNRIRPADLARRLGVPTSEVARITNPKYKTKIDTMERVVAMAGGTISLVSAA